MFHHFRFFFLNFSFVGVPCEQCRHSPEVRRHRRGLDRRRRGKPDLHPLHIRPQQDWSNFHRGTGESLLILHFSDIDSKHSIYAVEILLRFSKTLVNQFFLMWKMLLAMFLFPRRFLRVQKENSQLNRASGTIEAATQHQLSLCIVETPEPSPHTF